jgi:hypothetical protein
MPWIYEPDNSASAYESTTLYRGLGRNFELARAAGYITLDEAARRLGVDKAWLSSYIARVNFPSQGQTSFPIQLANMPVLAVKGAADPATNNFDFMLTSSFQTLCATLGVTYNVTYATVSGGTGPL